MQIVIDIPDDTYKKICDLEDVWDREPKDIIFSAIAHGTPLPKGHGDLIDRNNLRKHERSVNGGDATWLMDVYLPEEIDNATVVIEADKAESEDKE